MLPEKFDHVATDLSGDEVGVRPSVRNPVRHVVISVEYRNADGERVTHDLAFTKDEAYELGLAIRSAAEEA